MSTYNRKIPHLLKSDPDWPRRRAACLSREPLCRHCAELGYATPATTVDHIIPRARGGTSDEDNLQPLCKMCHDAKTGREKHGGLDDRKPVRANNDPKNYGNSPRARFLNRGYHDEQK